MIGDVLFEVQWGLELKVGARLIAENTISCSLHIPHDRINHNSLKDILCGIIKEQGYEVDGEFDISKRALSAQDTLAIEVLTYAIVKVKGKRVQHVINAPSEYQLDRMIAKCDNVINKIVIPGKVRSHFSATVETYEPIV